MRFFINIFVVIFFCSCEFANFQKQKSLQAQPIASVDNAHLFKKDIKNFFSKDISRQDSLALVKNLINAWVTKQLLLKKAEENSSIETAQQINILVKDYRESLLINNYKEVLIKQQLDTLISEDEITRYYHLNKNNFKLNEELIKIKYLYFDNSLIEEKDIISLFQANNIEDVEILEKKQLNFKLYEFNDTIWRRLDNILLKIPFSKEKLLKKTKFLKKQDSLGLYLAAVKDVIGRNSIAPLSYIKPSIRQMILHKRKIDLIRDIEKIIVRDATQNKSLKIH